MSIWPALEHAFMPVPCKVKLVAQGHSVGATVGGGVVVVGSTVVGDDVGARVTGFAL